ncbi:protein lethal(2)essential for life-like isoform X1 [Nilaparvata lugens]|uniref:protein lethal(2)essential for life-like isoform X1 n=1 Tax=Nilaparvata lugens TaxID=108931 RepID=UPI00193D2868|nr:protein lethal(2)essential for life-like isoform X1 [Nilaparvata lugens]
MAESGVRRNIPVRLGDFSVIDSEFSNIRERFDAEMRKMEDEMTKFRSELMNRESNFFKTSSRSTERTFSTSSNTVSTNDGVKSGGGGQNTWLESINSPLIQEDGDNKCLKLRFDVSQYQPEEIIVKTVDNKLLVHAKHEEKSDSKSVYREYNREFLLPKGTNPESIKSSLSKDGVLTVEAPLPALGAPEKLIPITHK